MKGWVYALAVLAVAIGPAPIAAQQLAKCVAGQAVTDKEGKTGVILADDSKLCQVKYADGQVYSWIYWNLRPAEVPAKSRLGTPQAPITKPPPVNNPEAVSVLRPSSNRTLVYRADGHGNFMLTAAVNGAPIRAVVDTGASLVALTLEDAQAAGISRSELVFSGITHTANGPARFAPVMLREVRIEQVSIENVPAAVMENLPQSLLGMSFLSRLKSFEMHEGALTINW